MIKNFAETPDVGGLSDNLGGLGIGGGEAGEEGGIPELKAIKPDEDEYSLNHVPNIAPLDFGKEVFDEYSLNHVPNIAPLDFGEENTNREF
jgi:hypothetical protein